MLPTRFAKEVVVKKLLRLVQSLMIALTNCFVAVKYKIRQLFPVCPVKFFSGLFARRCPSIQEEKSQMILADLQGNILKSNGRSNAIYIFLEFKPGMDKEVRKWIVQFAAHSITGAESQTKAAKAYRHIHLDGGVFAHFALSQSGYDYLGVPVEKRPLPTNPQRRGQEVAYSNVFAEGMKHRQELLLDPPLAQWDKGYQKQIHALVLLAADELSVVNRAKQGLFMSLSELAVIHAVETGMALHREFEINGEKVDMPVEHFGFMDGRSQPLFFAEELEEEKNNGGIDKYDPSADLSLVLVKDPLGKTKESYGSFMVFRKLEQNVAGFHRALSQLAEELGIDPKLAGAMAMGRFEDGSPVVDYSGMGKCPLTNNFNYSQDPEGLCSPFQAHARKSNPRHEAVGNYPGLDHSIEQERGHRIVRRGIPYGGSLSDFENSQSMSRKNLGLLFVCYQSDIWEQFEFIQRRWSNNPYFLKPMKGGDPNYDVTGLDPIIGQRHPSAPGAAKAAKNWPAGWNRPTKKASTQLSNFVTFKGGEYFFSPSISALLGLAD